MGLSGRQERMGPPRGLAHLMSTPFLGMQSFPPSLLSPLLLWPPPLLSPSFIGEQSLSSPSHTPVVTPFHWRVVSHPSLLTVILLPVTASPTVTATYSSYHLWVVPRCHPLSPRAVTPPPLCHPAFLGPSPAVTPHCHPRRAGTLWPGGPLYARAPRFSLSLRPLFWLTRPLPCACCDWPSGSRARRPAPVGTGLPTAWRDRLGPLLAARSL